MLVPVQHLFHSDCKHQVLSSQSLSISCRVHPLIQSFSQAFLESNSQSVYLFKIKKDENIFHSLIHGSTKELALTVMVDVMTTYQLVDGVGGMIMMMKIAGRKHQHLPVKYRLSLSLSSHEKLHKCDFIISCFTGICI